MKGPEKRVVCCPEGSLPAIDEDGMDAFASPTQHHRLPASLVFQGSGPMFQRVSESSWSDVSALLLYDAFVRTAVLILSAGILRDCQAQSCSSRQCLSNSLGSWYCSTYAYELRACVRTRARACVCMRTFKKWNQNGKVECRSTVWWTKHFTPMTKWSKQAFCDYDILKCLTFPTKVQNIQTETFSFSYMFGKLGGKKS